MKTHIWRWSQPTILLCSPGLLWARASNLQRWRVHFPTRRWFNRELISTRHLLTCRFIARRWRQAPYLFATGALLMPRLTRSKNRYDYVNNQPAPWPLQSQWSTLRSWGLVAGPAIHPWGWKRRDPICGYVCESLMLYDALWCFAALDLSCFDRTPQLILGKPLYFLRESLTMKPKQAIRLV